MTKKQIIKSLMIVILLIAVFASLFTFYLNIIPDNRGKSYPVGIGDFQKRGEYYIDPRITLINLEHGKKDILTPAVATPEGYLKPLDGGEFFLWGFSDHLKMADVLWQQVWGDNAKDWSIFRMYFYADCQDSMNGFSIGDFVYFKSVTTQAGTEYTAREILIRPLYGIVEWGDGTSYPRPLLAGWRKINLGELKVTADDALRIAEENGGKEARMAVNNRCSVFLSYNPNVSTDSWNLKLDHDNGSPSLFEININPYTGNYKIVKPGK